MKKTIFILLIVAVFATLAACTPNTTATPDATPIPTATPAPTPNEDEVKYNEAVALMEEGKYAEALKIFKDLNGYKDSAEKVTLCQNAVKKQKYDEAMKLKEQGNYDEAVKLFLDAYGYEDAADQINICKELAKEQKYNAALALYNEGKYEEAAEAFRHKDLAGYKDVAEKLQKCEDFLYGELYAQAKVGETIKFGKYEQDNDLTNGLEDIAWIVLKKENGKLMLTTEYALEAMPFNTTPRDDITWEICTLRKWLNSDFMDIAFTEEERAKILLTDVIPDDSKTNETKDNIFLLSCTEADYLFKSDQERACYASAYALANGAAKNETNGHSWYWLRSKGDIGGNMAICYTIGQVEWSGHGATTAVNVVRPTMWIQPGLK